MTDPLSITAGVIAVAGLAYSSAKTLNEAITSFLNAPKVLQDIGKDLQILQNLLQALQQSLNGVPNTNLSENERACFESLRPALEACKGICDDFSAKLSKMTSHSQGDKVNWWDRARLHFNEKDVALLKLDLEKHKQTVDIAIGVATLKTVSQNRDALQSLETKIATSVNNFTGQIMGLETALQSMMIANVAVRQEDVNNIARVLNEHGRVLRLCLQSCTSGLKETSTKAGTHVKYARTFNEAKQVIGIMGNVTGGGPPTVVEYAEARDKSRQFVGDMNEEIAKKFWD